MLETVGHKRRFRIMMGLFGIAPFVIYWLAISDTIAISRDCAELQKKYDQVGELDVQLRGLRNELDAANATLGMKADGSRSFQTQLLTAVSDFCNQGELELVGFSETETALEGDMKVETIPVTVQGRFKPSLEFVQFLESKAKTGRLISVNHYLVKIPKSRKKVLRTTAHVQNIRKAS